MLRTLFRKRHQWVSEVETYCRAAQMRSVAGAHNYVQEDRNSARNARFAGQERGVAQVVRHHDGGIQRREIQRRHRLPVVPHLRIDELNLGSSWKTLQTVYVAVAGCFRVPHRGMAMCMELHRDSVRQTLASRTVAPSYPMASGLPPCGCATEQ